MFFIAHPSRDKYQNIIDLINVKFDKYQNIIDNINAKFYLVIEF